MIHKLLHLFDGLALAGGQDMPIQIRRDSVLKT
jgi:hypothetical protein